MLRTANHYGEEAYERLETAVKANFGVADHAPGTCVLAAVEGAPHALADALARCGPIWASSTRGSSFCRSVETQSKALWA